MKTELGRKDIWRAMSLNAQRDGVDPDSLSAMVQIKKQTVTEAAVPGPRALDPTQLHLLLVLLQPVHNAYQPTREQDCAPIHCVNAGLHPFKS